MKKFLLLPALFLLSYSSFAIMPIIGTVGACVGGSTRLHDTTAGGTWSSSLTSVATIISSTGIVTAVAAGVTTITYTVGGSYVTATFEVTPAPAIISGPDTVCPGATITLTDDSSGGTWSCTPPSVATISAFGVVSGVASGYANVQYTVGVGCYTAREITVGNPVDYEIWNDSVICEGSTSALRVTIGGGPTTGGTWTSGNPSVAPVSTSGVVSGLSTGFALISYSVTTSCGVATATKSVWVIDTTTLSTISGGTTTYVTGTLGLSGSIWGGTWTSSNTAIATVGSSSGLVTGIATGTAIISYAYTGCGGLAYTTEVVTITPTTRYRAISTFRADIQAWCRYG